MTETRPTQEDLSRAEHDAKFYITHGDDIDQRLGRVMLALAAENKALEERVRRLRIAIREDLFTDEALHNDDLLAAADAKAAGEPDQCAGCDGSGIVGPTDSEDDVGPTPCMVHDTRASRRREYVRDKAPVIAAGVWPKAINENACVVRATELAGLIFDETEPSE